MVLALVFFSSYSKADQTSNILNNTWSGNYGFGYWGGTSGGQIPNLGGSTFYWGHGGGVLSNTIAINNALQEEGVQVEGYSYVWKIKNGNANEYTNQPGIDPMEITVEVYKANGDLYQTYVYDYGYSHDWTAHSGSETFPDQFLDPAFFGNITVKAEGDDSGYWAGWYGPEFNTAQSSLTLTYSSNPCYGNPLYDPACDGYAEAVAQSILEQQAAELAAVPEPEIQEVFYEEPIQNNTSQSTFEEPIPVYQAEASGERSDSTKEKMDAIGIAINAAANDVSFVLNNIIGESNGLEINQTQSSLGMGNAQTQSQSSSSSNQNDSEERQTQGQKLKEAAKQKAAGLQEQIVESEEMDEQQAAQAEMLAMMNYVPGFDSYKVALAGGTYPDVPFYPPSNVPDSRSGVRNNLAQQLLHQEMVDMQYRR